MGNVGQGGAGLGPPANTGVTTPVTSERLTKQILRVVFISFLLRESSFGAKPIPRRTKSGVPAFHRQNSRLNALLKGEKLVQKRAVYRFYPLYLI
jgi:hypothetical protein